MMYTPNTTVEACAEWIAAVATPHTVIRSLQRKPLSHQPLRRVSVTRNHNLSPTLQNRKERGRPHGNLFTSHTKMKLLKRGKRSDACLRMSHVGYLIWPGSVGTTIVIQS